MNICLATLEFPPFASGGISTYYSALAQLLAEAGHRVTVLTSGSPVGEEAWACSNVDVVRLGPNIDVYRRQLALALPEHSYPSLTAIATGLAMRDWLVKHCRERNIDVVETHEYTGACAFLLGKNVPPLMIRCHSSVGQLAFYTDSTAPFSEYESFLTPLERIAITNADELGCYSYQNLADWDAYLGRTPRFSTAPFIPRDNPGTEVRPDSDMLHGITVARLQRWKGPIELMEALKVCVRDGLTQIRIEWIGVDTNTAPGGGSMLVFLQQRYPDLWGTYFKWIDHLEPPDVRARQAAADFAVAPSLWDTFNYSAIEAMSLGTPLIVSSGVGASYLAQQGHNALVVPPSDVEALATAIKTLAVDATTRGQIGEAGKETIRQQFSPSTIVREHVADYESAIRRHRYRQEHRYSVAADELTKHFIRASESLSYQPTGHLFDALLKKGKRGLVITTPRPVKHAVKIARKQVLAVGKSK